MVRFSLNIKTFCLCIICKKQDQIWAKIFFIPKSRHSRTTMHSLQHPIACIARSLSIAQFHANIQFHIYKKSHLCITIKGDCTTGVSIRTFPAPNNLVPRRPEAQDQLAHSCHVTQVCWRPPLRALLPPVTPNKTNKSTTKYKQSNKINNRSERCWRVVIAWVCSRREQRLVVPHTSPITALGQTPNNNTQDKNNIYQYFRYTGHFHFLRLLNCCGFVVKAPTFIKPEILHSGHRLATSQIENLMRF